VRPDQSLLPLLRYTGQANSRRGRLRRKAIGRNRCGRFPFGRLECGQIDAVPTHQLVEIRAVAPGQARQGLLYVFTDCATGIRPESGLQCVEMPITDDLSAPIVYSVALQLLAYHAAVQRGADVDRPRNLAKSVTVE